jgi:uncharacterized protein
MRLNQFEINSIKQITRRVFGDNAKVFLFGSRVDDSLLGGDIDLYIQSKNKDDLYLKQTRFIVDLKMVIGDQKIDVIVAKNPERLIEQEALSKGIML